MSAVPAKNKNLLFAIAGVVVLALMVVWFSGSDEPVGEMVPTVEVAVVQVTGVPLPSFVNELGDVAVGMEAPGVSGVSFTGEEVSVAPGEGSAYVLGFFAHWCPHCQRELPGLSEWMMFNDQPANVEVVAVSTAVNDGAPNYPPSAWFREVGWTAEVLVDSEAMDVADAFGLSSYPFFVLVGADGNVVARVSGEIGIPVWERLLEAAARG